MKKNTVFKKPKRVILMTLIVLLAIFTVITLWENITVGTTFFKITSDRLPASFNGFKIAQISDLHNAELGQDHSEIIRILKEEKPQIIVITGDLIDSNHLDMDTAISFVQQAVTIAPCYYVTGNHEAWIKEDYQKLEDRLLDSNVIILHDEVVIFERDSESIQLIGLDDPEFSDQDSYIQQIVLSTKLSNLNLDNRFRLLLSHRPEAFDAYVDNNIDLVLSGHTHGGQFRLPFIGGVVAPNQGFFPKVDAGEYHEFNTTMIVSRGVGNSIIPIRINNRPEVVIVELVSQR